MRHNHTKYRVPAPTNTLASTLTPWHISKFAPKTHFFRSLLVAPQSRHQPRSHKRVVRLTPNAPPLAHQELEDGTMQMQSSREVQGPIRIVGEGGHQRLDIIRSALSRQ